VLLAVVAYVLFHLHQIGLPRFLKERLLTELSAQGLMLDYSRLRLEFGRGIVADNVALRFTGAPEGQFAFFRQVTLNLDRTPILSGDPPTLEALVLSGGEILLPVEGGSGVRSGLLQLKELAGQLEFAGTDRWRLVGLSGQLNQMSFEAMGTVSGLSRFLGQPKSGRSTTPFRSLTVVEILNGLDAMRYREEPRIEIVFSVDGQSLEESFVQIRFATAGAISPHGEFDGVRLGVGLRPEPGESAGLRGSFRLESDAARTRWGAFNSLKLEADTRLVGTNFLPVRADWKLSAQSSRRDDLRLSVIEAQGLTVATTGPGSEGTAPVPGFESTLTLEVADVETAGIEAHQAVLSAALWNPGRTWNPASVTGELRVGPTRTAGFQLESGRLRGTAVAVPESDRPAVMQFWTRLAPWRGQIDTAIAGLSLSNALRLDSLSLGTDWRGGRLQLTQLNLTLPGGQLTGGVTVDAVTRTLDLNLQGDATLAALAQHVPPSWWLAVTNQGIHPGNRLAVELETRGELPPWDTPKDRWLPFLRSSLAVNGGLRGAPLDLGGVVIDRLEARFGGASDRFTLESLRIVQGAGELNARGELDARERWFEMQLDSTLDLLAFRPLIRGPGLGRQLDLITFDLAPRLAAEARGSLDAPERLGFRASVGLTNATYRGEPVTELRTTLDFTNRALVFTGTDVRQGDRAARAPYMRYDLTTQLLYITNAQSNLALDSLGRIIGPKTARTLSSYQFPQPPQVQLTGYIPISAAADADVVFQARAPQFEWWYFRFTNIIATVGWRADSLSISNVTAGFHNGVMSASVEVDLSNRRDTVFSADTTYADVDVTSLMADLVSKTNQLGGVLTGQVVIREGHGRKGLPWRGEGNSQIRDGVLWGLPLFGMLSPVLDALAPGMGKAQFNAGNAFFVLTNNVVSFSTIELLSSVMRLDMKGDVGFDGELNLLLEARPLRGVPLLGALLDFVLSPFAKLFEYEVRGTLGEPTAELKNVPSFLLAPLRPFKTLKTIFVGPESKTKPETPAGPEPR